MPPPAPPTSCLTKSLTVATEKRDVVESWVEWFPEISFSIENLLNYKIIKSCVLFWKFNPNFVLMQNRGSKRQFRLCGYVNDISINK